MENDRVAPVLGGGPEKRRGLGQKCNGWVSLVLGCSSGARTLAASVAEAGSRQASAEWGGLGSLLLETEAELRDAEQGKQVQSVLPAAKPADLTNLQLADLAAFSNKPQWFQALYWFAKVSLYNGWLK
ncbi:hypothetical protein UY3_16171 [Chelonia mydas]|uniref:Uncharacterized protein n=1 Tax=Chelonia mydas TaxID=8469 RepID=M7ANG0_CHEMY|nr:hypothetical protein UY3_16171 [Chelonia mydas]